MNVISILPTDIVNNEARQEHSAHRNNIGTPGDNVLFIHTTSGALQGGIPLHHLHV